jgi:hypothetical protein
MWPALAGVGAMCAAVILTVSAMMISREVDQDFLQISSEISRRDGTYDNHMGDVMLYLFGASVISLLLSYLRAVLVNDYSALASVGLVFAGVLLSVVLRAMLFNLELNEKMGWPRWYFSNRGTDRVMSKIFSRIPMDERDDFIVRVISVSAAAYILLFIFI